MENKTNDTVIIQIRGERHILRSTGNWDCNKCSLFVLCNKELPADVPFCDIFGVEGENGGSTYFEKLGDEKGHNND